MSKRKTSFVLPTDCLDDLADFSDKEAGELFRAILEYANSQIETEFSDRATVTQRLRTLRKSSKS